MYTLAHKQLPNAFVCTAITADTHTHDRIHLAPAAAERSSAKVIGFQVSSTRLYT